MLKSIDNRLHQLEGTRQMDQLLHATIRELIEIDTELLAILGQQLKEITHEEHTKPTQAS